MPSGHCAYARGSTQSKAVTSMGDKSPKAKDKAKKQDTANKNQKAAAATSKASAVGSVNNKKTK